MASCKLFQELTVGQPGDSPRIKEDAKVSVDCPVTSRFHEPLPITALRNGPVITSRNGRTRLCHGLLTLTPGRPNVFSPSGARRPSVRTTAGSGDPRRTRPSVRTTAGSGDPRRTRPSVRTTAGSGDPRRTRPSVRTTAGSGDHCGEHLRSRQPSWKPGVWGEFAAEPPGGIAHRARPQPPRVGRPGPWGGWGQAGFAGAAPRRTGDEDVHRSGRETRAEPIGK